MKFNLKIVAFLKLLLFLSIVFYESSLFASEKLVIATSLNVRNKPNTKATIVGSLKKYQIVQTISNSRIDDWIKVKIINKTGYVSLQYLQDVPKYKHIIGQKCERLKELPIETSSGMFSSVFGGKDAYGNYRYGITDRPLKKHPNYYLVILEKLGEKRNTVLDAKIIHKEFGHMPIHGDYCDTSKLTFEIRPLIIYPNIKNMKMDKTYWVDAQTAFIISSDKLKKIPVNKFKCSSTSESP